MKETILLPLYASLVVNFVHSLRNNVCDNPFSYSVKDTSPRCRYNPDVNAYMPELVTQYGLKVISYDVATEDGYILKVFNIPKENPKGVIYLQHPAYVFCHSWVAQGPDSLGIALANAGYDVWLGNFRGSYYSRRHKRWNPDKDFLQYWNFTFHEMSIYDLPAQIDLIINKTNAKQVAYVGFSLSGTTAAVYASLRKEHAEKYVRKFILMGPSIFLESSFKSTLRPLRNLVPILYEIFKNSPLAEIFGHNSFAHKFAENFCSSNMVNVVLCQRLASLLLGGRFLDVIDWETVPMMFSQGFGGISLKAFSHLFQNIGGTDQKLAYYDYGEKLNQYYYNSRKPPFYPLEVINSSMHIMAAIHDEAVPYQDVRNFYNLLLKNSEVNQTFATYPRYGHSEFYFAKNIAQEVNTPILEILNFLHLQLN